VSKVSVRFPSFVFRARVAEDGGWVYSTIEAAEGDTVLDLLSDLVAAYPGFREAVFNPETGAVAEQVAVVLNDQLLTFAEMSERKLVSDDRLVILPVYAGG
jgi:molybdopterin converting factor small subunit